MNRMLAVLAALLVLGLQPAQAQTDAPPSLPPEAAKPAAIRAAAPRQSIELTPAERQAIDEQALRAVKPASVEQALVPSAEDLRTARPEDTATRIEQTRTGNRVTEVTVTPAHSTRSYVMTNREGRQPVGITEMSSGLSVPMFFRVEFGRSGTPAAPAPSPPAAPSR
jgi:hypothetical protein